ncbi:hypothetical protein AB0D40_05080 [Streptomyces massasporeus]
MIRRQPFATSRIVFSIWLITFPQWQTRVRFAVWFVLGLVF